MPKIFVSHACDDNDVSKNLADYLRNDGAEFWIYYSKSKINCDLRNVLKRAIDSCNAFVLVWSRRSVHSRCVKLECQTALKFKKKIIACLLDDTKQSIMLSNF